MNSSHYILRQVFAPIGNGLLVNAVALTIRNITPSGANGKEMRFVELSSQVLFTGTNASSGSLWGVQRVTATPAAGAVVTPFLCHPAGIDPSTLVECRFTDTATITGVVLNGTAAWHTGIASQIGSAAPPPLLTSDENAGITLGPGQCLVVYVHGANMVAGTRMTFGARWFAV